MRKSRTFTPEFKAKVVLEIINEVCRGYQLSLVYKQHSHREFEYNPRK